MLLICIVLITTQTGVLPQESVYLNNLQRTKQYYSLNGGHAYVLADCNSNGILNKAYCIVVGKEFESAASLDESSTIYLCTCPLASKQRHRLEVRENSSVALVKELFPLLAILT